MASHGIFYGGNTILSHPIFVETILPFLLVFTIVFGVLQKSKIFGDGKRQIDAIVALVIGLLVISFAQATGIILQITVFMAVSLVILLVLMILLGSFTKEGEFFEKIFTTPVKIIAGLVVTLGVIIAVVYITGFWQYLYDWIFIGTESEIFINALFRRRRRRLVRREGCSRTLRCSPIEK